ncbi:hypothetical protein ACWFQ8_06695 [Streptomyces sp. NPDC055254]
MKHVRRFIPYPSAGLNRSIAEPVGRATHDPGPKAGLTGPYAYLTQYVPSRTFISPDPSVTVCNGPIGTRAIDSGSTTPHFTKVLS